MGLREFIQGYGQILMEGSIVERLRRSDEVVLDPYVLHGGLIYHEAARGVLGGLYRQYMDIGKAHGLPLLNLTPTWRTTEERIGKAGLGGLDVNGDGVRFLQEIRESYGDYGKKILIGGLVGCQGDTYRAAEALTEAAAIKFHEFQLTRLVAGGVDFLYASAMPALSEALGLAKAMAATGCPYIISFLVRPTGILLDGTWLQDAIEEIDNAVDPAPVCYMVTCVHPTNFRSCVEANSRKERILKRLIGLQANTSAKSPEELDNLKELDSQEPVSFGQLMVALHRDYGTKILGGCCGSDQRHIGEIAKGLKELAQAQEIREGA